jgi:hypothetical protein
MGKPRYRVMAGSNKEPSLDTLVDIHNRRVMQDKAALLELAKKDIKELCDLLAKITDMRRSQAQQAAQDGLEDFYRNRRIREDEAYKRMDAEREALPPSLTSILNHFPSYF